MAEKPVSANEPSSSKGNQGDGTAPAGIDSPGTFVPLDKTPQSVDQKTERGKTGKD